LGVRRSAEFLAFPALLLFATLIRLALNVQTTPATTGLIYEAAV